MDRRLLIAEPLNSDKFIFATSHFESTAGSFRQRKSQMQQAFTILDRECPKGMARLIVGDFNFDNRWEESSENYGDKGYVDIVD